MVVTSISPFGQTGPHRGSTTAHDFNHVDGGGALSFSAEPGGTTGPAAPQGPPVKQAGFQAGVKRRYRFRLGALYARLGTGQRPSISTSRSKNV